MMSAFLPIAEVRRTMPVGGRPPCRFLGGVSQIAGIGCRPHQRNVPVANLKNGRRPSLLLKKWPGVRRPLDARRERVVRLMHG